MSIFGPRGFDAGSGEPSDIQFSRMQESRYALYRILEFTRYSIDDVINDPIARFRVRYYYRINRYVDRYLKEKEREELARQEAEFWVIRL